MEIFNAKSDSASHFKTSPSSQSLEGIYEPSRIQSVLLFAGFLENGELVFGETKILPRILREQSKSRSLTETISSSVLFPLIDKIELLDDVEDSSSSAAFAGSLFTLVPL